MTASFVSAVAFAASLAIALGPSPGPRLGRLAAPTSAASRRRSGRTAVRVGGVILVLAVCAAVGGATVGVLMVVATTVGATAAGLLRSRRADRRHLRAEADVARACALLAAEVRAGRPPESAVEIVSTDCPVLVPAAAALSVGDDAVRIWRGQAPQPGCAGLHDLSRAWEVSRACGAPMGPSLDQVAAALEREAEVAQTVRGELASAQATGRLMSVLPLVGIGLGYTIGGRPLDFLIGTPAGLVCTLAATLLACLGILWTQALGRVPGRRT